MENDRCVFLDAGHGGLDAEGNYTTAPGKMYRHRQGGFHDDGWFYEGVWNRRLSRKVAEKLQNLGVPVVWLSHDYLDLSLQYRVDKANWYHRNFREGILISNHANASLSHRGRGFEVYTTQGETGADPLAELHWNNVNDLLGDRINMRSDESDGDHDKEVNFFILKKTVMPAMLVEHLFFDNYEDAQLLMDEEVVELFAEAQVRTVIQHFRR